MKFNFENKPLGKLIKTPRGFQCIEFKDHNGESSSLQQSSVATESLLWLGVNAAKPMIMAKDAIRLGIKKNATEGWVPFVIPEEVLMTTRMHLSRENVAGLIVALNNWLFTDQLDGKPELRSIEGVTDENAALVWQDELRRQIGELLRRLQESGKSVNADSARLLWASKNPALFAAISGGSGDIEKLRTVIDVASFNNKE